ncbi:MAG: hypothetical protein ACRD4B_08755, partial [Acidobacteriota bacterium]
MTSVGKITWSVVILGAAGAALASQIIEVRQRDVRINEYTANSGELTKDVLVGQTFTASDDNLAGISVMFGTYSGRRNTAPIEFHLRQSVNATEDLRVARAHPSQFGDNQLYRFDFEPLPDSGDRVYFFYVVSPQGEEGNAVAVDLHTGDPYHLGTAYLVPDFSSLTDSAAIAGSGKQTIDLSFATHYSVVLREAIVDSAVGYVRHFIATWDEKQGYYHLWLQAMAPAAGFVLISLFIVSPRLYSLIERVGIPVVANSSLILLFLAALLLRILYASELPVTNDEGNYLYDAWMVREGVLAGGDGYVKAPLVLLWVSFWQWILGNTIIAGRLSSVVIGSLTIVPIY